MISTSDNWKIHKEWSIKDQVKKDEETYHVIMSKDGSVVNNKLRKIFKISKQFLN